MIRFVYLNVKLSELPLIYKTAIEASMEASDAIVKIYNQDFKAVYKEDGSPVTEADIESSKIIHQYLAKTNIPAIGEEIEELDYSERSKWSENWLIDPLDGTKMFLRRNDEFSVNIAHIVQGKATFGIITSPTEREILFGNSEYGVHISTFADFSKPDQWKKVTPMTSMNNPLTVICSRDYTHGSAFNYMQVLEREFGELNYSKKGSALKFFDLVRGSADIYARFAPTMEWDIAPGQAILEALGGQVVDVRNNNPLRYNKKSLYNPHFIAMSKAFAKR